MAMTAGSSRWTRLDATPANGSVLEVRAPSHAEDRQAQRAVVAENGSQLASAHLLAVPRAILEQDDAVIGHCVVGAVADVVEHVKRAALKATQQAG
jgi:hypothetical protein